MALTLLLSIQLFMDVDYVCLNKIGSKKTIQANEWKQKKKGEKCKCMSISPLFSDDYEFILFWKFRKIVEFSL